MCEVVQRVQLALRALLRREDRQCLAKQLTGSLEVATFEMRDAEVDARRADVLGRTRAPRERHRGRELVGGALPFAEARVHDSNVVPASRLSHQVAGMREQREG